MYCVSCYGEGAINKDDERIECNICDGTGEIGDLDDEEIE